MKIRYIKDLSKESIKELCYRGSLQDEDLQKSVKTIIDQVKKDGDEALLYLALRYEKRELKQLYLNKTEIDSIASQVQTSVKNAIDIAYNNIWSFHQNQLTIEKKIETMPGVLCWRESRAIEKVGLYIPGGSAVLPSTLMMLGIPAKIAKCEEIIVCTPAHENGLISPEIAYILNKLEIPKVYLVGGAQAIAAMTFGTYTVPQVDKICGPGNSYVTEAKIQLQRWVAIDMPAGPSEVLIIADQTANPAYVAADLLAQAEHGPDSQAILVTTCETISKAVLAEMDKQLALLPRQEIAKQALNNSFMLITNTLKEALDFSNEYAPEHLILCCADTESIIQDIKNAGSVFVGNWSPESAGDYASGTNHTLPTSGFAKAYSGVSLETFLKKISFQQLTEKGLENIGPTIEKLAEVEALDAHKNAVTIRLNNIKTK